MEAVLKHGAKVFRIDWPTVGTYQPRSLIADDNLRMDIFYVDAQHGYVPWVRVRYASGEVCLHNMAMLESVQIAVEKEEKS